MSGHSDKADSNRGDDVVVMKFGGTSVEDAAAIRRLIGIVREQTGRAAGGRGERAGQSHRSTAGGRATRPPTDISERLSRRCGTFTFGTSSWPIRWWRIGLRRAGSRIARRVSGSGIAAARSGDLRATGSESAGSTAGLRRMLFQPTGERGSLPGRE